MTGGQILAGALSRLGARTLFSVSGNQILPIYDAAPDFGLRIIHTRHESAAAYAAAASAELSDQPGIVLVSAGPGFLAALTGVATARFMELPLLFLSGASPVANAGFGTFQELDQTAVAKIACKASLEVSSVGEIESVASEAWKLSQSDVPGPVYVGLPADLLLAHSSANTAPFKTESEPERVDSQTQNTLREMVKRLAKAQRPVVIARPSAGRGLAGQLLSKLTRNVGIKPIISEAPRGLNDLKYSHMVPHFRHADCLLLIGPADFSVAFLDESVIATNGAFLHVDAEGDPAAYRAADLHVRLPVVVVLRYLAEATEGVEGSTKQWSQIWIPAPADLAYEENSSGSIHPVEIGRQVRQLLRPDDVVVLDGGEFCQWIRLGLRDAPNRILWNSKFGGIGGSIPMALGVALTGHSGRTIAFLGDGCAGYHLSEFETAVRYQTSFVAIVGNDSRWSTEWHMQARRYGPERTIETNLLPARYGDVASGFGANGFHVEDLHSFISALSESLSSDQPACINVQILSIVSPAEPT